MDQSIIIEREKSLPQVYALCGLRTYCEFPLRFAEAVWSNTSVIDVSIVLGRGVAPFEGIDDHFSVQHSPKRSLIGISGIADFEISLGRHIRVWPAAGAAQKDIDIYLFGLVWASLCHQRLLLPL